jgi:Tfp pilus assembly protein PilF
MGDSPEALKAYHKAVHVDPKDYLAYKAISEVYTLLGR